MGDYFSAALNFLSGLALFLYGIRFMSDKLEAASGKYLKNLLSRISGGIFRGFVFGAVIAALIQSSSATTVMVVGLVNARLMTLTSATGVIIGANLGTTVTSWLLSLSSVRLNSVALKIVSPDFFAPVFALVAIFMRMISKNRRARDISGLLLGFSILMIGLNIMTSSLLPFENSEILGRVLYLFDTPAEAFLVGVITSALVQSSSAAVGILQAFSVTGLIPYSVAIPMVMGQNIGTCTSAILSSVGTNRNARRAALIHLYYNVIGAASLSVIFYATVALGDFSILSLEASSAGIALVHTLFNLASTFLILPFARNIQTLAIISLPDKKEEYPLQDQMESLLDKRFLSSPSIALSVSGEFFEKLFSHESKRLKAAFEKLSGGSEASLSPPPEFKDRLCEYLLKLDCNSLSYNESNRLFMLVGSIEELDGISKSNSEIFDILSRMEKETDFSDHSFFRLMIRLFSVCEEAIRESSLSACHRAIPLFRLVQAAASEIKQRRTCRILSDGAPSKASKNDLLYNELISQLERMASHCHEIALGIIKSHFGGSAFDMREYVRSYEEGADFYNDYNEFKLAFSSDRSSP